MSVARRAPPAEPVDHRARSAWSGWSGCAGGPCSASWRRSVVAGVIVRASCRSPALFSSSFPCWPPATRRSPRPDAHLLARRPLRRRAHAGHPAPLRAPARDGRPLQPLQRALPRPHHAGRGRARRALDVVPGRALRRLLRAALLRAPAREHLDHGGPEMSLHLQGMWVAFTVAAAAHRVLRRQALERHRAPRRRDRRDARAQRARSERLASVTTLAAGAAHELGTPLATIAVASQGAGADGRAPCPRRAGRAAGRGRGASSAPSWTRCRAILNRLGADAGQPPRRSARRAARRRRSWPTSSNAARRAARAAPRSSTGATAPRLRLPRAALLQVAQNLVRTRWTPATGARRRSGSRSQRSALRPMRGAATRGRHDAARCSRASASRSSRPRPPGTGLGLGVFIARTLSRADGRPARPSSRRPAAARPRSVEIESGLRVANGKCRCPMTRRSPRSLLIVEDDDVLRGRLARAFRERGFEVREAAGRRARR